MKSLIDDFEKGLLKIGEVIEHPQDYGLKQKDYVIVSVDLKKDRIVIETLFKYVKNK